MGKGIFFGVFLVKQSLERKLIIDFEKSTHFVLIVSHYVLDKNTIFDLMSFFNSDFFSQFKTLKILIPINQ